MCTVYRLVSSCVLRSQPAQPAEHLCGVSHWGWGFLGAIKERETQKEAYRGTTRPPSSSRSTTTPAREGRSRAGGEEGGVEEPTQPNPTQPPNGFPALPRPLPALHSGAGAARTSRIALRRREAGQGGGGPGHGVAAGHRDVVRRRRGRRQRRRRVRVRDAGGHGADEGAGGVGEPRAVQGRRGLRRLLQGQVPGPRHLLAPGRDGHRHGRVPRRPLRVRPHALRPQRRRLQQDGRRRRRRTPARPGAAERRLQEDCLQVRREEHRIPCERGLDQLLALAARRVRGRRRRHWIHADKAGKLGGVAGHEARVGGHVVPGAGPARGALLREADHAVRQEDAHGPGRHPQELGAQGHLHLAPQLRAVPIEKRRRPARRGRGNRGPTFYRPRTLPCGPAKAGGPLGRQPGRNLPIPIGWIGRLFFFCIQAVWPDRSSIS